MTNHDERIAALQARVAELEAALAQARHAATRDPLTGLLNRAGLIEAWANWRHRPGQMLALIDLDGFKGINDRYGHAAGDAVLCAMNYWMRDVPLAARLGGDEFVAVIDNVGWLPARVGAQLPDGPMVSTTMSIGLAPAAGSLTDVLRQADAAMYHAKASGGHYEVYNRHRHDRPVEARPLVRLRDDSAIVARDTARSVA
ncbi:GGDEF domain-containing protein [Micromonospora sp. NPDC049230]|uniref:GGDEF domain-containing protein n=1 Tax=Micromonospora sp. NPDC049230 TaxID=3155502 RepID=UPI00340F5CA7